MSWPKGKPRSEETKRKISAWGQEHKPFLGHHHSDEAKQILSISMSQTLQGNKRRLGIPHTEETKEQISKTQKGRAHIISQTQLDYWANIEPDQRSLINQKSVLAMQTEESKKRAIKSRTGIPLLEAHKKNISDSHLGEKNFMFGKQHSEETKKKISQPGDKNPRWRGGISSLPYPFTFDKDLKERIRERDGYRCQLCGVSQAECTQKLSIHHKDYCKENLADENLTSLCRSCNSRVNSHRDYWERYFRKSEV